MVISNDSNQPSDLQRIQRGLNLRPLGRTVRRNLLLVAGIAAALTAFTAMKSLKAPRSYSGGFRLLVEPITGEAKLTDPSVLSRGGEASAFSVDYPTLLQVLQSPTLLSKVAERVKKDYPLVTTDALVTAIGSKQLVVQRIGTNLLDNTKLIDVTYQGNNPYQVQAVLEALSQEYLAYSLEARKSRISGGVEFIEGQLPDLKQRVTVLQKSMQGLQERYKLTNPSSSGDDLVKQALTVKTQKEEALRELQEQRILYARLQNQLQLSPQEAIAASVLSQDPTYQKLLADLKQIDSQLAIQDARYSEESPVVLALQDQRRNLANLLAQETQRIVGRSQARDTDNPQVLAFQNSVRLDLIKQLADAANQIQVLEVRSRALASTEQEASQKIEQIPQIIRRYNEYQRELEIATRTLNQLTIQRDTLSVEAAQKEVPWQLAAKPALPLDKNGQPVPMPRDIKKKVPMGAVGGIILGIICAVLLEKIRNIFYVTEDVQDAVKVPVVSVIPYSRQVSLSEDNSYNWLHRIHLSVMHNTLFRESFNNLLAGLRFLGATQPIRSLVISSASPGEGKTTVAVQLAQTAADAGQKVLLVDANFRLPQVHTHLGLDNHLGLADILEQKQDLADCIQPAPDSKNLMVVTAGHFSADSPRKLASQQMKQLVDDWGEQFDLVIYDSPHLLGITDSCFLTAYADGLLLVVGIRASKRSIVMQALTTLQEFQLPVLGVVTNHPRSVSGMSYGYQRPIYHSEPRVSDRRSKSPSLDS
ncbi:tyrosine-protein kinase domain-containing protein [Alkalinema sp. FACHB-956]|uniref:GumC family protein n=1 Tax=Alkalinema sp. FACHB-956 TaxID=2692768 RepID=UPI001685413B|nr:tyrosine-protein kinase domain-containing protein [Alkalinema sp. FACHB-956]MBD2329069.1 polysaccharide biosynthesis tyrosine autokinase [Alkalinema sp. FACHB-956]